MDAVKGEEVEEKRNPTIKYCTFSVTADVVTWPTTSWISMNYNVAGLDHHFLEERQCSAWPINLMAKAADLLGPTISHLIPIGKLVQLN